MKLNDIIDRIKLPFRKEKELFSALYTILGFYPHNIEYYKMALMHKSIRKRNDKGKPLNNERLEFLGDAILDAAVGYIVYRHYEGKREGFLTNTRSKLVSRETPTRWVWAISYFLQATAPLTTAMSRAMPSRPL